MSQNNLERTKIQEVPNRPQQALQWAICHPGVLLLSSLAVGSVLAWRRGNHQETITERRVETEADIIDGDVPLFI